MISGRVCGFLIGLIFLTVSCGADQLPFPIEGLNPSVTQVVIVQGSSQDFRARLWAFERKEDQWHQVLGPLSAVVGRNGIAPAGEKREGDGRAPSGIFDLDRAFGYAPQVNTGLVYSQISEQDLWVDDPRSPQYNQWTKTTTDAKSFEVLRREDDLYKLAAVIEYNTDPVVAGNGSAIFLHVWRGPDKPTAGCVALKDVHVQRLLKWLDKNKNPKIIIQESSSFSSLRSPQDDK